ncbi:MAG TPA: hypothetical protein VFV10_06945, partial [Gammaproteobacteria bacterium]|nr:hypothetical protein [Gammaproteobacteria bacterium]
MRFGPAIVMLASAALVVIAAPARAQDAREGAGDSLDVTMTLLPEKATRPDAVTRVIELPEAAQRDAADRAANAQGGGGGSQSGASNETSGETVLGASTQAADGRAGAEHAEQGAGGQSAAGRSAAREQNGAARE